MPEVMPVEPESPVEPQGELQRDLLDDFLFHAANYIYVRRKLFISLAVVLVLIIVSVYGIFRYIAYRENLRNVKLFTIEKIINDAGITAKQRSNEAMPLLEQLLEEYPDTSQAALAQLHRGNLHYADQKFGEAEADFEAVRATQEKDSELYLLASIYLSNVLRDQGKLEPAIEVLQSTLSGKMVDVILMELAELFSQSGQNDKAREKLDILLKDFPKSPYAERARQMLKLL